MSNINQLNDKTNRVSKRNELNKIESEYLKTKDLLKGLFSNTSISSKMYILLVSIIQSDITRNEKSYKVTKEKLADIIVNISNEEEYLKLGLYLKVLSIYGGYGYILYKQHSFMFDENKINHFKEEYMLNSLDNNFVYKYSYLVSKYEKFLGTSSYEINDLKETLVMFKNLSEELMLIKDKIDRNLYLEYAINIKEKIEDLDMLIFSMEDDIAVKEKKIIK